MTDGAEHRDPRTLGWVIEVLLATRVARSTPITSTAFATFDPAVLSPVENSFGGRASNIVRTWLSNHRVLRWCTKLQCRANVVLGGRGYHALVLLRRQEPEGARALEWITLIVRLTASVAWSTPFASTRISHAVVQTGFTWMKQ
jgi:hypothetical protein